MKNTTGNYQMDKLIAMLPPSNNRVVYIPYLASHKRSFERTHYATTFGTNALSEENLAEFLKPIEDSLGKYIKGTVIPVWIFYFLCCAIIPLFIFFLFRCFQGCCGKQPPTLSETNRNIQEYLMQQRHWLKSKGLKCTFQYNKEFMLLIISKGKSITLDISSYSLIYKQKGQNGTTDPNTRQIPAYEIKRSPLEINGKIDLDLMHGSKMNSSIQTDFPENRV